MKKLHKVKKSRKFCNAQGPVDAAMQFASHYGLIVKANAMTSRRGKKNCWHVMFNDSKTGARILDWWPTNGTWFCKRTGERGKSKDAEEVVQIAYAATRCDDAKPVAAREEHLGAI